MINGYYNANHRRLFKYKKQGDMVREAYSTTVNKTSDKSDPVPLSPSRNNLSVPCFNYIFSPLLAGIMEQLIVKKLDFLQSDEAVLVVQLNACIAVCILCYVSTVYRNISK